MSISHVERHVTLGMVAQICMGLLPQGEDKCRCLIRASLPPLPSPRMFGQITVRACHNAADVSQLRVCIFYFIFIVSLFDEIQSGDATSVFMQQTVIDIMK